jgi:hypothetical protein
MDEEIEEYETDEEVIDQENIEAAEEVEFEDQDTNSLEDNSQSKKDN